ncbi:MAG: HAMP domain-containing protein [Ignavibacteriales bacterium]|nr:MAG: HAMP domain-containing protein [Ignavibacteriales bacterium]
MWDKLKIIKRLFSRLSIKLILGISTILLINLAIYTYITHKHLKANLLEARSESAFNTSDLIKKSTRYSMLLNRREDVYQIINTVGTESGVERIRIYNKSGHISFSTDASEIGQFVDKYNEACVVCHSQKELPHILPKEKMIREFTRTDGRKVIGLINPIKNDEDCYNDACHAHSSDTKILGVLDVILSTEKNDELVKANISDLFSNGLIITALISVFSILLIAIVITKPLSKISRGIEEISNGILDYQIDINSKDELGQMALQFNLMSNKLKTAYEEIKDWSETLNQRVNEKNEELKNIYEQISQTEKLASLGKLSATVAHELNNPLEGILTYSKLISKKLAKLNENNDFTEMISYLKLISDESTRCGKIVKDLLLFARKGTTDYSNNYLSDIIDKSLMLLRHHFEMNKIKVIHRYCSENPEVYCDSQKIVQALVAVIVNSIEAIGTEGTIDIHLTTDEEFANIRITDTGKGIAEEDQPYIFEPFFSTKGKTSGTGLGLPVAYGIVNQHKGKMRVEQTSARGTTMLIQLPLTNFNEAI